MARGSRVGRRGRPSLPSTGQAIHTSLEGPCPARGSRAGSVEPKGTNGPSPHAEKVSAKLTDAGSRWGLPSGFKSLADWRRRPLIRRLRRHLLPQGKKDGKAIAPRTPL